MTRRRDREGTGVAGRGTGRRSAMMKTIRGAFVGMQVGVLLGGGLLAGARPARALTTSDRPAAILIWPKIVVGTTPPTDTLIQVSNTDKVLLKQAHCFYVNANSHCGSNATNAGAVCQSAAECPSGAGFAACEPGWSEIDFDIFLTKDQPLAWHASSG